VTTFATRRILTRYLAVIAIVLLAPLWLGNNAYNVSVAIGILMFALPALGAWLLLNCGIWSFGQGAFASLGAYTTALLLMRLGVLFWPALLAGGVVAAAVSLVLVYPFLRTSGVVFSILTLVGLSALDETILLTPPITGGGGGLIGVPAPPSVTVLGVNLATETGEYFIIALLLVLALAAVYCMDRAGYLRILRASAQNEDLAEAVGINTRQCRAAVFVFAAFLTGLAGAFSASYLQSVQPSVWDVFPSIYIVAYAIVGGVGSAFGPLLGTATIIFVASELSSSSATGSNGLLPILLGACLAAVVLILPGGMASIGSGVVGAGRRGKSRLRRGGV